MKKQIKCIRFFLLMSLLFTGIAGSAHNHLITDNHLETINNQDYFSSSSTYSWTGDANAILYVLEVVNTQTQQSYKFETTGTSATLWGVPGGTYALTVTAYYANQSASIIVEDVINH